MGLEVLGRSKDDERVEGLAVGWTETVRLTGKVWSIVAFLSLDEKGGG